VNESLLSSFTVTVFGSLLLASKL